MAIIPAADGGYLRELLGKPFTDEQLAIITADLRPQLVIAGAGSGKTTVMAARVVHAIAWHGVRPDGILGLTFTNKAASELAERVRLALAALARLDEVGELQPQRLHQPEPDDQPTVSTYHAYAASLIKDHALRIGREPDSRLLTEAGRWQLALRVVRAAPGPYSTLTLIPRSVAERVLDLDGAMADHLVTSDQVRELDRRTIDAVAALPKLVKGLTILGETATMRDELLDLVDRYRQRKRALDLVDFGDQVALAAEIARRCPEVGVAERERFPVVFLDEYQDTGVSQRVLLADLFGDGHPVTAVGDPCQSIYGWRGASIGNLLRFFEHFPCDVAEPAPLYLLTSFRNGGRILDGANQISATLRADKQDPRRRHVAVPPLESGREELGQVRTALHTTVLDEVEWLAERLHEVVTQGTAPSEIAVLCRRRSDFSGIHRALAARDLPVEVVGLGGLLEMPEVADVVAVLEVLADPTANAALARILTGPRYRLGPRDLKALGSRAAALARGSGGRRVADGDGSRALAQAAASVDTVDVTALTDALDHLGDPALYSREGYARLDELRVELTRFRPLLAQPIVEAVVGVVGGIGLDVEIEATPGGLAQARAANLSAFLDHAAGFEGVEGESDLAAFLDYLAAAGDKERGLDIGGASTADTIKLMTVHKAKGLEWSVVALPGLVDTVFPSNNGRALWVKRADALPHELRGDADDLPVLQELTNKALTAFGDECRSQDNEEERRLAYVAATRAKDLLLASGYRWSPTRKKALAPSVFLTELREAVPPEPSWADPWDLEPDELNPLLEMQVPDVAWPAPYREGPAARRRAAAALVGGALSAPAPEVAAQVAGWDREVGQLLDELAASVAPVRDVVLPRTLSASQVVALAGNPEELARALARPMPRRPSAAARRGTAFHAWVEHLFDAHPLFDTDELAGAADDVWSDEVDGPDLSALQASFAEGPYGDLAPYAVEAPFELVVGGRLLRGRIDAVYRTDDGFDVVDYKTGLRPTNPEAVALQLAIYRLAWAGIAGVPVEQVGAAFLYVRTGKLVRPELAGADEIAALLGAGPVQVPPLPLPVGVPPARSAAPPRAAGPEPDGQLSLEW